MPRNRNIIYIDRDPGDIYKGWGWVEVDVEDVRKFNISTKSPETYMMVCRSLQYERYKFPNNGNLPSRGRTGTKKFRVSTNGELIEIRAQKSLTIKAICHWVKTWVDPSAKVITPGNSAVSISGEKLSSGAYFIYFIFNEPSQAIKIGLAKDVEKRLKALQTSNSTKLRLIKTVQVVGREGAQTLEKALHKQFDHLRLNGEWFKAESDLFNYIEEIQ